MIEFSKAEHPETYEVLGHTGDLRGVLTNQHRNYFYYLSRLHSQDVLDSELLRAIADKLDELNGEDERR